MIGWLLCRVGLHDVWRWADDRGEIGFVGMLHVYCKRPGCDW